MTRQHRRVAGLLQRRAAHAMPSCKSRRWTNGDVSEGIASGVNSLRLPYQRRVCGCCRREEGGVGLGELGKGPATPTPSDERGRERENPHGIASQRIAAQLLATFTLPWRCGCGLLSALAAPPTALSVRRDWPQESFRPEKEQRLFAKGFATCSIKANQTTRPSTYDRRKGVRRDLIGPGRGAANTRWTAVQQSVGRKAWHT